MRTFQHIVGGVDSVTRVRYHFSSLASLAATFPGATAPLVRYLNWVIFRVSA